MDVQTLLENHLKGIPTGPFLFVGSGLSRRYLDLETWDDLLKRFCIGKRSFQYYLSTAHGQLPKAASLISRDFHKLWWTLPSFANSRELHANDVKDTSHALKTEIAEYVKGLSCEIDKGSPHIAEIELLKAANIDGIITTNWDVLLERLFPDFKPYVGQDSLLFSSPASIAEIYKIHGCCTDPSSLVLTDSDYKNFNRKNAYLAAKLLTIFIEHPVIFLGYSLSDANVTSILTALVLCLGREHIEKLQDRLIFVEWRPNGKSEPTFAKTFIKLGEFTIPITAIKTASFSPIFESLLTKRRKLPLRILRYCKEQIYELVKGNDPKGQLVVTDIDNTVDNANIEFVVGLGIASIVTSQRGYRMITVEEIIQDLLFDDKAYNAEDLLKLTVPLLLRHSRYIPLFKYLKKLGIADGPSYKLCGLKLDKAVNLKPEDLRMGSSAKHRAAVKQLEFSDVCKASDLGHALQDILLLDSKRIVCEELHNFLKANHAEIQQRPQLRTVLRKVAYRYDRMANGWPA